MNHQQLINLKILLAKLHIVLHSLFLLLGAGSTSAQNAPTFGAATVTSGNNYPTSSYSFNDADIINAGDLNLFTAYTGIRSATDTVSLQGQIYNVSSTRMGIASATLPSDSQFLSASSTIPTWKTLIAGQNITIATSTTSLTISSAIATSTQISIVAGEDIANLSPVYIGSSTGVKYKTPLNEFPASSTQQIACVFGINTGTSTTNAQQCAQAFIATSSMTLYDAFVDLRSQNTPSDKAVISLNPDNNGVPSSTMLASSTILPQALNGVSYTGVNVTGTWNGAQILGNTKYWIVFSRSGALDNTNNYVTNGTSTVGTLLPTYSYDGTQWCSSCIPSSTQYFTLRQQFSNAVYNAAAGIAGATSTFIGFSVATTTINATATIQTAGILLGEVGLTTGGNYYLGNTTNTIQTTAGSSTRKVGIEVTSSTLLITNIW